MRRTARLEGVKAGFPQDWVFRRLAASPTTRGDALPKVDQTTNIWYRKNPVVSSISWIQVLFGGKVRVNSMASKQQNYPSIPAKAWRVLREQFRQALPGRITPTYLAAVLETSEGSVKKHVLPGLKRVGIVAEDGVPTPRANRWRDDEHYSQVCWEIREEIYPQELLDAVPDPSKKRESAISWFMTTTSCGRYSAERMVALYALLADGNPHPGNGSANGTVRPNAGVPSNGGLREPTSDKKPLPEVRRQTPVSRVSAVDIPEMRISVEIRIDASVTPEQIDLIFASMAKHLYRRDDEGR